MSICIGSLPYKAIGQHAVIAVIRMKFKTINNN